MELIVKHFDELTTKELFEIYKLRVDVFVVEQKCPYPEVDDADLNAYHIWLQDKDGIEAYARALSPGVTFSEASIGRVIAKKRRLGLGTKIVSAAIDVVKEKFETTEIKIGAQVYAKALYESLGFQQISEPYLEDEIPHILMKY